MELQDLLDGVEKDFTTKAKIWRHKSITMNRRVIRLKEGQGSQRAVVSSNSKKIATTTFSILNPTIANFTVPRERWSSKIFSYKKYFYQKSGGDRWKVYILKSHLGINEGTT